jgi:branched-chain amino acid transport system substrate-binding protein
MSAPINDDSSDSEHSPYAPKRLREQSPMPATERSPYVSMVPSSEAVDPDRLLVRREVAAAKFIEKTRDLYPDMTYTSVSFVGSTALADELMLLGKRYATGVIVTQVVPAVDGHSSLVLDYKSALAKYFPGQAPDYVSLEGYVDANVLIAALQRNGRQLDTEKLVGTLENLRDLDIGLGTPVTFGRSEHQGVHKVWGTQLDATGHYQPIDLQ